MMFVMLLSTQKVCFGSDQDLVDGQRSDIATGGLIIANIEFLIFSLLLRIFLLCSALLGAGRVCPPLMMTHSSALKVLIFSIRSSGVSVAFVRGRGYRLGRLYASGYHQWSV